jgi:hypothetical protein
MNRLSTAKRVQFIAARVKGSSISMMGVAKHMILNHIEDKGCAVWLAITTMYAVCGL